jgi:hypothetical protein
MGSGHELRHQVGVPLDSPATFPLRAAMAGEVESDEGTIPNGLHLFPPVAMGASRSMEKKQGGLPPSLAKVEYLILAHSHFAHLFSIEGSYL